MEIYDGYKKLKLVGLGATIGSFIGGISGLFLAGPPAIVPGAKAGLMLGAQAGLAVKVDEGIDEAGRKVNVMADKAGGAIEQLEM